ncbi:MAG: family 16 glycosylhydrolase [Granulosicoccus sp.]
MTIPIMNMKKAYLVCLFSLSLSACGESDLEDIHDQRLDDAIAAEDSPVIAPALPDTDIQSPPSVDLSEYELVFSDEFQGNELDGTKWGTSALGSDTIIFNQLQYYVDTQSDDETLASPFTFDGEHMTINATTTPDSQRADANGQAYLSGLLTTRDTFDFTYGYIEARVNVEQGRGLWPSLWMLGAESDDLLPEVYVFEYDGAKPDSVFHNYNFLGTDGNLRSNGQEEIQVSGFSEGFHTLGLRWSPEELLFYVDGQPTYLITGESVPGDDMYLILNLAIGGVWLGAPDATTPDPATLEVDYVRVYQEVSQ